MSKNAPDANEQIKAQVQAYADIQSHYQAFSDFMSQIFNAAVRHLKIEAIVGTRAKGLPNFAEKAIRRRDRYPNPVHQFDDLCGARVIVNFLNEIEPVCDFILTYFDIDDAESEDVGRRLGVSRFGYRSIHFTVSLNAEKIDRLFEDLNLGADGAGIEKPMPLLYEHRSAAEMAEHQLSPGPKYRAEVQVRTLMAHAWAVFAHDRVYKSEFEVPDHIERSTNRLAAMLEGADNEFGRMTGLIEEYETSFGAYMSHDQRTDEMEKLQAILQFDSNNVQIAFQIARLALSLDDCSAAVSVLQPFVIRWEASEKGQRLLAAIPKCKMSEESADFLSMDDFSLFRDVHFAPVLLKYGQAQWLCNPKSGHNYIKWACAMNNTNADTWVEMAETFWNADKPDIASQCYTVAYKAEPSDPRVLAGMVQCRIVKDQHLSSIPLVQPSLEAAIDVCQERANVGIYLPNAFYDIGLFQMLLGKSYESLSALALGVLKSDALSMVDFSLKRIERIGDAMDGNGPGDLNRSVKWAHRLLLLAAVVKSRQIKGQEIESSKSSEGGVQADYSAFAGSVKQLQTKAFDGKATDLPVRIVAGGCHSQVERKLQEYGAILKTAFKGYDGIVISGGTRSGIAGLVGDLPSTAEQMRKLAYSPSSFVQDDVEAHPAYDIFEIEGEDFSPLEPLQGWIDLLAKGVDPAQVRLLGINGGKIASFEFRLALAMGATVGVVRESGRAALEILSDPDWKDAPGLIQLPSDPQTIREFIQAKPSRSVVSDADQEKMARDNHAAFQQQHQDRIVQIDPSIADWDELPEDLRDGNLQLIADIENKLARIGYRVIKASTDDPKFIKLDDSLIEKLAEMEHGRWNIERLLKGWKLGERDVIKKTTPYFVPWTELSEEIKGYDRDAVLNNLELLKKYGYNIEPDPDSDPDSD